MTFYLKQHSDKCPINLLYTLKCDALWFNPINLIPIIYFREINYFKYLKIHLTPPNHFLSKPIKITKVSAKTRPLSAEFRIRIAELKGNSGVHPNCWE